MGGLSLSTTKGIMRRIGDIVSADFQTLGVSEDDFNLTTQDAIWSVANKRQVTNVIDAMCFSTLDQSGLPRHAIPAEFVAAVIGTFVAPANQLLACNYISQHAETGKPINELAAGDDPSAYASVSPSQLYALCVLAESDAQAARKQFEDRIKRVLDPVSA